jgi:hypothetical protein
MSASQKQNLEMPVPSQNSGQSSKDGIASHYGLRPEELKGTNDFNNDLLNKYLKVNYMVRA